jgi:chromosome segregation ATPase
MSGADWAQTHELLQQITAFFESEDDSPAVAEIRALHADMENVATERVGASKAELARAAAVNENLQNQATREEDASVHAERVREEKERQQVLRNTIQQLTAKKERLQAEIASIQKQKRHTMEQAEEQDADRRDQVPRAKHTVELYAKVSNIRWTSDDPEEVVGYVSLDGGESVREFDFARRDATRAEMVDRLWGMM